jgi:surfeit locus 1 family protein
MTELSARRSFAPRPWAVALTVGAVAACLALGTWQIGRAREKQALIDTFDRGGNAAVPLPATAVDTLPRYQRVVTSGHFESGRQILIDNMPSRTGQAGYRVLTPFRRAGGGRVLLVDRGWVPMGVDRSQLPAVAVTEAERSIKGRLDRLPVPGLRIGPARAPDASVWPLVLNFPRTDDLEAALGEPVESRILLLDPDEPDGFERAWRPAVGFPPERHLGYAIQWFALALALLVAFVATSLKPRSPETQDRR